MVALECGRSLSGGRWCLNHGSAGWRRILETEALRLSRLRGSRKLRTLRRVAEVQRPSHRAVDVIYRGGLGLEELLNGINPILRGL